MTLVWKKSSPAVRDRLRHTASHTQGRDGVRAPLPELDLHRQVSQPESPGTAQEHRLLGIPPDATAGCVRPVLNKHGPYFRPGQYRSVRLSRLSSDLLIEASGISARVAYEPKQRPHQPRCVLRRSGAQAPHAGQAGGGTRPIKGAHPADDARCRQALWDLWGTRRHVWCTARDARDGEPTDSQHIREGRYIRRPIQERPSRLEVREAEAWAVNNNDASAKGRGDRVVGMVEQPATGRAREE
jgi:hypothetical protein